MLIHEWKNLGKIVTVEKIENLENPFPCRIAREKKIEAKYILLFKSYFFL
jgi:hypothetical protein